MDAHMKGRHLATGRSGEALAADYLASHGYRLVDRNFRTPLGELDIVAFDGDTLVFAEVKTRRGLHFGEPAEAVNWRKQMKLRHMAQLFMKEKGMEDVPCRFDVISIMIRPGEDPRIEVVRNAF